MPSSEYTLTDVRAAFTDHDRLFKELLTVFFAEFIELFVPEMATRLDPDSVTFLNQEIFNDVTAGEKNIVDLLVQAKLRSDDAAETEEAYILIHVENQAKAQLNFARRMFLMFAQLDRKHELPIYPIAVFSFDEPLRQEPHRYSVAFPWRTVLDFQFDAIQLNRLNWRDFVSQPNAVAAALMSKMKIAPEERPRVKLECLRLLATLKLDPARTQLISGFVDSYLKLTAQEMRAFEREIASLPEEEREATMPLTISWKEEGIAEGIAKGIALGETKGRIQGERRSLLRFGEQRLGPPSAEVIATIEAIDSTEELDALSDRLPEVQTWEDLLAETA